MADVPLTAPAFGNAAVPLNGPQIDWSKLNQPIGQMTAAQYTPTQHIGNGAAELLMHLGMQPYVAHDLTSRVGNVIGASPLGVAGSAMDTVAAKAQGDNSGVVRGMAGMIPGVGPEARAATEEALAAIERAVSGNRPSMSPSGGEDALAAIERAVSASPISSPTASNLQSKIIDAVKSSGGTGVRISDVAAKLPGIPLKDIHAEMMNLQRNDQAVLSNWDDPKSTTAAMKAAAINVGGDPRHAISLLQPQQNATVPQVPLGPPKF